jgi:hypothetical protein
VVIALTLLGFAIKILKPESIILALMGMIFLYMFVDSVDDGLEISTMNKKIRWYRNYSIVTYVSGALIGFLLPFESTQFISLLINKRGQSLRDPHEHSIIRIACNHSSEI